MENNFFLGFMDELMKVAGGAKASIDPKTGKWVFKPVATPKINAPGSVPPTEPKFKPGSGYKPFQTGKAVLKGKSSGLVGGQSRQRGQLEREGVFLGGKAKTVPAPSSGRAREIKLPSGGNMAREIKLPQR